MYSVEEFLELIDNLVPEEMQAIVRKEHDDALSTKCSWTDIANTIEHSRVITIKKRISSTHKWEKAVCSSNNHRSDIFWCSECQLRASVFEYINTMSIINKVMDNLPTYTPHNQFLMLTCDKAKSILQQDSDKVCLHCGVGEGGKSPGCQIITDSLSSKL